MENQFGTQSEGLEMSQAGKTPPIEHGTSAPMLKVNQLDTMLKQHKISFRLPLSKANIISGAKNADRQILRTMALTLLSVYISPLRSTVAGLLQLSDKFHLILDILVPGIASFFLFDFAAGMLRTGPDTTNQGRLIGVIFTFILWYSVYLATKIAETVDADGRFLDFVTAWIFCTGPIWLWLAPVAWLMTPSWRININIRPGLRLYLERWVSPETLLQLSLEVLISVTISTLAALYLLLYPTKETRESLTWPVNFMTSDRVDILPRQQIRRLEVVQRTISSGMHPGRYFMLSVVNIVQVGLLHTNYQTRAARCLSCTLFAVWFSCVVSNTTGWPQLSWSEWTFIGCCLTVSVLLLGLDYIQMLRSEDRKMIAVALLITMLRELGILEAAIPDGYTRIRWRCSCGYESFDDYPATTLSQRDKIITRVGSYGHVVNASVDDESRTSFGCWIEYVRRCTRNGLIGIKRSLEYFAKKMSNLSHTEILKDKDDIKRCKKKKKKKKRKTKPEFLLLCIRGKRFSLELYHEDVEGVKSDGELFRKLAKAYKQKTTATIFNFRKLIGIRFVEFDVWRKQKVNRVFKYDHLPPKEHWAKYKFSPRDCDFASSHCK